MVFFRLKLNSEKNKNCRLPKINKIANVSNYMKLAIILSINMGLSSAA